MKRLNGLIIKQSKALLESKQLGIILTVLFSVLPFTGWLSVAIVSLVTLRKGAKTGFEVMVPALIFYSVPLMTMVSWTSALANSVISYVPCYFAALTLRKTMSWQLVYGMFLILALMSLLLLQLMLPDFIVSQFNQFKSILVHFQDYKQLIEGSTEGLSSHSLAHLFFGIQILSAIVSALISLMFARSVQAKLFMPGGFAKELSEFRSGKLAFMILIGICLSCYFEMSFALDLLPLVLGYFFISGFALAYFIIASKKQFKVIALLFLIILLKPSFVLLTYIVFGALDSLFNFRLYLPSRVREST